LNGVLQKSDLYKGLRCQFVCFSIFGFFRFDFQRELCLECGLNFVGGRAENFFRLAAPAKGKSLAGRPDRMVENSSTLPVSRDGKARKERRKQPFSCPRQAACGKVWF